jgi:hypothetical protein
VIALFVSMSDERRCRYSEQVSSKIEQRLIYGVKPDCAADAGTEKKQG